jgi:hypothetical protein
MLRKVVDAREVTVLRGNEKVSVYIPEEMMQKLMTDSVKFAYYRFPFVIDSIVAASPAQLAGLQKGDSIVALNGALLQPDARTRTSIEKASILRFPFLLEEDNVYGGDTPFRTYKGMRYHGGYSDHLPVLLELIVEE